MSIFAVSKLIYLFKKRPDGGIGRRAGLKNQWINFLAGSIPAPGTKGTPDCRLIVRGFDFRVK